MHTLLRKLIGTAGLLVLCMPSVQADIFTWTDAQGRVHYSDQPPADRTARALDLQHTNVSTIGGAALRPEEREWLTQMDQRRAEAQRAAAQRAALAPIIITPPAAPPEPQPRTRTIIRYPVPYPHYPPQRTTGLGLELSSDHWRLQFGHQIHHHTRRSVPDRRYPRHDHDGRNRYHTETEVNREAPNERSRPPNRYRPQATRWPG